MRPHLFTLPGLGWEIQGYGLMLALALLLAWGLTLSWGRRDRLPSGPLGTAFVLATGFGLMGARFGWLLQRPGETGAGIELFALRSDELAPFVGVTVAAVVGGLYLTRRRIPAVAGFDVAAPAFMAALMVERLGALMAGTDYGRVAPELPWAIRFPPGSPAFLEHQRTLTGMFPVDATQSLPVHPTQLYGLLVAGAALGVGLWLRKRRTYSGQVVLGTLTAYLLGRSFFEEWFRADAAGESLGPFSSGQVAAIVLAVSMVVIMRARAALAVHRPAEFRPWEGGRWTPAELQDGRPSPGNPGRSAARSHTGSQRSLTSGASRRRKSKAKNKGKRGKKRRKKK
ncbi:MAG: prolipoprotein diacylglyceryl transferase family protein [Myxococcota bacterium]